MKRVSVVVFFILAGTAAAFAAEAKSPAVLLQQGIYAEETEGNLEKAMEIYSQIRSDYNDVERVSAIATYQLGRCNLKKDNKQKAKELFQEVINYFPEQKVAAKKAQEQLDKILPPETKTSLQAPVVIKTSPENFANNISPDVNQITITFDKTMSTNGYSWCQNDSQTFPDMTGKPFFSSDKLSCTLPVKLKAGQYYRIGINTPPYFGFKGVNDENACEYIIVFATADANDNPTTIPEDLITEAKKINSTPNTGAILAPAKPLKLEPAPWVDGEVMELKLKHPAGNELGTIIYSAQKNEKNWQIISHTYANEGRVFQYTFVKADAESFAPVYGQTTNWMGNFVAEYGKDNVKLAISEQESSNVKNIPVAGVVYDNEQAIYLIRRMLLAEGYEGSFPIFSVQGNRTVECRIKVLAIEDVNVEAGNFKCCKTSLAIYAGGTETLRHTLWFSADSHKYLVKYDVGGAATMELAKVWQREKNKPFTFYNAEPAFSVAIPTGWFSYKYGSEPKFNLQLMPPDIKAWSSLLWQKRGSDPNSASAMTIAKADCKKLAGFFKNYKDDEASWKQLQIAGLEAVQYTAGYQDGGSGLKTYDKPKDMVEYRTYIVDAENVYWFVFRVEKNKFDENRAKFDSIIDSFRTNAK